MTLEQHRQQILNGVMYNDLSEELIVARAKAVEMTNRYNANFGESTEIRAAILRKLLNSVDEASYFESNFRCEFGFNICLGKNFYVNFDCVLLDGGMLEIGDDVLFEPRVGRIMQLMLRGGQQVAVMRKTLNW